MNNHDITSMVDIEIAPDRLLENLDDFTIEEKPINAGGFGVIYKGTIKSTGQGVAIKKTLRNDSFSIKGLIQEYNMMLSLNHPLIQSVIGLCHDKNSDDYSLITPFYNNGSLAKFMNSPSLKSKRLDNTQIFIIAIGVASGMKYLHKHDIAHRDLKPNNILINDLNFPIIIDFGISRNRIEQMSTEAGTYVYCAPEVFTGHYDNKVDVYSYGLIINEIFTRKTPFIDLSFDDMKIAKRSGNFELHPEMPEYLKKIIKKCLNPDPASRPTFKDIFQKLLSKVYSHENSALINSFLKYVKVGKKQKRFWRIPQQILRMPSKDFIWDENTQDPVNWDAFNKIIKPDDNKKILMIMTFGNHEVGKSTFLRTVTGNQGFYSGKGLVSTTMGILIDGPYSKNDLVNQVFNSKYQRKFFDLPVDNETQIFFLDSQGIGDDIYKNFEVVLDRINSIFCSVSSVCISIERSNVSTDSLQDVLKIIRRVQFSGFTKVFLLVREYQDFDSLTDLSFESLNNYQKTFNSEFRNSKKEATKYYAYSHLTPLPLGNLTSNYDSYLRSSWYSMYFILSQVTDEILLEKKKIITNIKYFLINLFGNYLNMYKNSIVKNRPKQVEEMFTQSDQKDHEIIKLCYSADYFISNRIVDLIELSLNEENKADDLMNLIEIEVYTLCNVILPYFLGEYDCSLRDYLQYRTEITSDIESYLKKNQPAWLKHMKSENQAQREYKEFDKKTSKYVKLAWIPFIGIGFSIKTIIMCNEYKKKRESKNKERENFRKIFNITIYPFLWDRDLIENSYIFGEKSSKYDISNITKIGDDDDQLIVFYEQNTSNDSTMLFRALTGYNVDFSKQTNVSMLFSNVKINRLMKRYMRNGKIHKSQLNNRNLNILYLKGCSNNQISKLCQVHTKIKPIFVSSMIIDQHINISPAANYEFYLFVISDVIFMNYIITKKTYLQEIDNQKQIAEFLKAKILPVCCSSYNFSNSGPFTQASIKYGCRLLLKDESLV